MLYSLDDYLRTTRAQSVYTYAVRTNEAAGAEQGAKTQAPPPPPPIQDKVEISAEARQLAGQAQTDDTQGGEKKADGTQADEQQTEQAQKKELPTSLSELKALAAQGDQAAKERLKLLEELGIAV